MKKIISKELEMEIINKYLKEHLSCAKIGKIYNLNSQFINNILKQNGIKMRGQQRDFPDESYFNKIDNENKAYLLGFLTADGCVYDPNEYQPNIKWQKNLSMMLQLRDISILEFMKKELKSSKKIKIIGSRTNSCSFSVSNDKICDDLISYGCGKRKSLTAQFPNVGIIPESLMKHYIRGLFDGDGCITSLKQNNKPNPSYSFDICGSYDICWGVKQILSTVVVTEDADKTPYKQGKIYRMYYRKLQSLKNIYHYLYDDASIFLERKRNKFKEVLDIKLTRFRSYDII